MARSPDKRAPAAAPTSGDAAGEAEPAGIDEILTQLEGVVADLEGGDLPLERALERFELGVRLARRGGSLLDRVEQRVETLLAERDTAAIDDEGPA